MTVRIEDVPLLGQAVKVLFDANKTGVVAYDKTFKDTWEANIFMPALLVINQMIGTGGLRKLNVGNTAYRDTGMNNETPIIGDLEYSIKKCITAKTITDSYQSFQISEFRESIRTKDIAAFHAAYLILIASVNNNSTALNNAGFTPAEVTSITTNHDLAWGYQNTKIVIKGEISELSAENKAIVLAFLALCMSVIKAIHAYAKSNSMKPLMKQASMAAILRSVRPAPVKKPRMKNVEAADYIIAHSNITLKKTMQFTLLTKGTVLIGKSETKQGEPAATMEITYKQLLSIKSAAIPGTGRFIKIINPNLYKVKVLCFVI